MLNSACVVSHQQLCLPPTLPCLCCHLQCALRGRSYPSTRAHLALVTSTPLRTGRAHLVLCPPCPAPPGTHAVSVAWALIQSVYTMHTATWQLPHKSLRRMHVESMTWRMPGWPATSQRARSRRPQGVLNILDPLQHNGCGYRIAQQESHFTGPSLHTVLLPPPPHTPSYYSMLRPVHFCSSLLWHRHAHTEQKHNITHGHLTLIGPTVRVG